uniref:Uncharacterized protein n=1 Tax=Salix viminalis TaxID=40686 RepID=A0A6N2LK49_SALVM
MSAGSDETHELSADNISEDELELVAFGDWTCGLGLDGERFSSKSNMGLSPTRLISLENERNITVIKFIKEKRLARSRGRIGNMMIPGN